MKFLLVAKYHRVLLYVVLPVILLVMHLRIFTTPLVGVHVWRQTQTQQNIENFVNEDFNILNPRLNNHGNESAVQRMEFPLMQWSFALFYKLFGDHLIITRMLSFIIGLFSVWGMFALVKKLVPDPVIALGAAWCFAFSPLLYYYSLNPLPDNLALCLAIWSLVATLDYARTRSMRDAFFAALLLMSATLCKLPFIVYGGGLLVLFLRDVKQQPQTAWRFAGLTTLVFIPAIAWYAWVMPGWEGNGVLTGILDNDRSRLLEYLWGNFSSTLPELLLNYGACLFFVLGFVLFFRRRLWKDIRYRVLLFAALPVLAYFIYELNMIATVHDYYLLPFLPFLFLLVGGGIYLLLRSTKKTMHVIAIVLFAVLPFTAFLRTDSRWDVNEPGFNKDLLVHREELINAVPPDALCIAGNDLSQRIMFYYIKKRGWNFMNEEIDAAKLQELIPKGARYLYSDSPLTLNDTTIRKFFRRTIGTFGSIQVYELKTAAELH